MTNRDASLCRRAVPAMGTIVTIQVVGHDADPGQVIERDEAVARAFEWFHRIEQCCTRFDPHSELMRLIGQPGVKVPVSEMLYRAVDFAVAVAETSGGAFDPTIGGRMEARGFNRNYRTGHIVCSGLPATEVVGVADIHLDPKRSTITLLRPLVLDLGGVAKGLAIDMAARELEAFEHFAIDAGGDLFVAGHGPHGGPWSIGIRHPRLESKLIDTLSVSNVAVCTSGDYERRRADGEHHIIDPRTGESPTAVASVTVVGPNAMLADALATAAFVLGPVEGIRLLEREGVDGVIVLSTLERHATQGMCHFFSLEHAAPTAAS